MSLRIVNNFVKILSREDKEPYELMVQRSFSKAEAFKASPESMLWTQTDDYYPVLGLYQNSELKSMMRVEWIESHAELLFKVDEPKVDFQAPFPMGYLAKAATTPEGQKLGFNSILRFYAFKIYQSWNVNAVVGTIAKNSSRHQTMIDLGYQFYPKSKPWSGNFNSDRQILIGLLDSPSALSKATDMLERKYAQHLSEFPLIDSLYSIQKQPKISLVFPWQKQAG